MELLFDFLCDDLFVCVFCCICFVDVVGVEVFDNIIDIDGKGLEVVKSLL